MYSHILSYQSQHMHLWGGECNSARNKDLLNGWNRELAKWCIFVFFVCVVLWLQCGKPKEGKKGGEETD